MASLPCSSQGKPLIAHLHRDLAIPPACWVTQRETFPNVSSDCFIPFVLIIARCIMQLLARATFPLGWCRISLASPSHVWKLWELWELHLDLVAPSGVRLRLGFVIAVVDLSHLATKSQHQMVLGKKKYSIWKFQDIWWVNLLSKPFDPLFPYSAANPEKHPSPDLIWIKQLILLGLKYRCQALIQPSRKVMGWPEPHSPNYPKTHPIQPLWRDKKHNPSTWSLFMELCSVTPVYSASVK